MIVARSSGPSAASRRRSSASSAAQRLAGRVRGRRPTTPRRRRPRPRRRRRRLRGPATRRGPAAPCRAGPRWRRTASGRRRRASGSGSAGRSARRAARPSPPPAVRMPMSAISHSTRFSPSSPTRSPGLMPASTSAAAQAERLVAVVRPGQILVAAVALEAHGDLRARAARPGGAGSRRGCDNACRPLPSRLHGDIRTRGASHGRR